MDKIRINLQDLLICMSKAQDIMSPHLSNHHQRVAYLAFRLAEQIDLPVEQQKNCFQAALIHDIGALSTDEKLDLIEDEPLNINNHAIKGAKLIERFQPLQQVSNIIKYHHVPWKNGEGNTCNADGVPFESHIIHIADRTCAMIHSGSNVISQLPKIISTIQGKSDSMFVPGLVDALLELSKKEFIWFDLVSDYPIRTIQNNELFDVLNLKVDDVVDLALVFSQIIDFRSSFTARHSAGVAKTAECLAGFAGFTPYKCKMMMIAGYLHDLGKLAVSNEILEKPGKLSEDEFNIIRSHSYYTYHLLESIPAFKIINEWASYHHERVDGTGYPFHIAGEKLSLGSRIMAVADVFTAVTEDRPYRRRMDDDSAKQVLNDMVDSGALDGKVVALLFSNFQKIKRKCEAGQQEATERYQKIVLS